MFYCNEVARDNRNVLLDNACLSVEAMGNDKWLILGQEKKQAWTGEGRTSSPLWKPDLIVHGRGLILDISCGYFGTSTDTVTQVPQHSLAGEDFWYVDVSLQICNTGASCTRSGRGTGREECSHPRCTLRNCCQVGSKPRIQW